MSHFATKDNTTLESEEHLVFLVLPLFHCQPPSSLEYISQTPEARGWRPPKKASWPPLDILLTVRSRPHWRLSKDKNGRQGPHFTPSRVFLPLVRTNNTVTSKPLHPTHLTHYNWWRNLQYIGFWGAPCPKLSLSLAMFAHHRRSLLGKAGSWRLTGLLRILRARLTHA